MRFMKARLCLVAVFVVLIFPAQVAHGEPFLLCIVLQASRMLGEQHHISSYNNRLTVRQTSEITCGPTALACLLNNSFGETTSEHELAELSDTYDKGTTTLLGLRDACVAKGYKATGYKMTYPQLIREVETSRVPVLVHFNKPSLHYLLVMGEVDDFVLVCDPSLGDISMSKADFLRRWSGMALVVRSPDRKANQEIVGTRENSARTRLATLRRASNLISSR